MCQDQTLLLGRSPRSGPGVGVHHLVKQGVVVGAAEQDGDGVHADMSGSRGLPVPRLPAGPGAAARELLFGTGSSADEPSGGMDELTGAELSAQLFPGYDGQEACFDNLR